MIGFTPEDELTVAPLSAIEKAWIRKLEKLLVECPDRLELMISGDPSVIVVDADGAKRSELCDGSATRDGVALAYLGGKPTFHGVSA
jgi:hypothetical protein